DGTAWCWGLNSNGQLGDETTTNRTTPVQVAALGANVAKIGLGFTHTCAITTDGRLWCWGANSFGQLGEDTTNDRLAPQPVSAILNTVAEVELGTTSTCARKNDGTLWCWGNNDSGQLGDGTYTVKKAPIQVASLGTAVAQVTAQHDQVCVRKTDNSV